MEILMVRIKVKPEHLDEFIVEMIGDAEGSVMNEPGCRRFDIVQDMDDPTMLALCEVYNDDAAIDDHRSRPALCQMARYYGRLARRAGPGLQVQAGVPDWRRAVGLPQGGRGARSRI